MPPLISQANMPARLKWAAMLNPDLAPMVAEKYRPRAAASTTAPMNAQATTPPAEESIPKRFLPSDGSDTRVGRIMFQDYQKYLDDQKRLGQRGARIFNRYNRYLPIFLEQFQPFYQKSADQASLMEQNLLSSIGSGTGRSGLSGSGMEQWANWAARGQRNAMTSDALTEYYTKAINSALEAALPRGRNNPDIPNDPSDLEKYGPQILSMIGTGLALSSDAALKEDITPLKPVTWKWNAVAGQFGLNGDSHGLIAQDVQKVWPDAVHVKNGYLTVDYPLVAARLATVALRQAAALERLGVGISGGI